MVVNGELEVTTDSGVDDSESILFSYLEDDFIFLAAANASYILGFGAFVRVGSVD